MMASFARVATRATALAFSPYLAASAVHVVAIVAGWDAVGSASKALLMPTLLLALVTTASRQRSAPGAPATATVATAAVALVASWFGDIALDLSGGFVIGLGCFFLAHVAWIVLLATRLRVRRVPAMAALYLLWWVAFVAILAPHTGSLLVPVAGYGLALGAVAALGLACNRLVAVGAALFLCSDSILGLHIFHPVFADWPLDAAVMVTYIAAQGLIVLGTLAHPHAAGGAPSSRSKVAYESSP